MTFNGEFHLGLHFVCRFPIYKGLICTNSVDEKSVDPDQLASAEAS